MLRHGGLELRVDLLCAMWVVRLFVLTVARLRGDLSYLLSEVLESGIVDSLDVVAVELVEHLLHLEHDPRDATRLSPRHLHRPAHV